MAAPKVKQRGAIVVMTVFFIIVLIGFAALALDLGRLYVLRTEMQNAADAAAIAAAAELDGNTGAIADAKTAAKTALNHKGKFAQDPELLGMLGDDSFEFYSWIGAANDGPRPLPGDCPTTPEEPNKCLTSEDSNAFYVKVKLYPELVSDGHYKISLFFLPVLNILLGDSTPYDASTRVSAVAGTGVVVCKLPPMLICDPAESGNPLIPGQEVLLKQQGGAGAWQPGNFGFLQPPEISGNLNKDLAYALANEDLGGCNPPTVSTFTGNDAGWPRWGINTRFGIYATQMQSMKDQFPPAPDVIDYPRDDNFTQAQSSPCQFDTGTTKFGNNAPPSFNGMLHTEDENCPASYGLSASDPNLTDNDHDGWEGGTNGIDPDDSDPLNPSASNLDPYYNDAYHNGDLPTGSFGSRYEYYQWELGISPVNPIDPSGNTPANWQWEDTAATLTHNPLLTTVDGATSIDAYNPDCKYNANKNCRIRSGNPTYTTPSAPAPGNPSRRIIYVAMLNCQEFGITGNTKNIYILPPVGRFAKFFLTEHINGPADGSEEKNDFYAEYLGEPKGEELARLIHTQIQLYE